MYNITIIGAGVSSIFLAYSLMKSDEEISIHIIDKGKKLEERVCGLDEGRNCTCEEGCSKYLGFAGLGKSEGKFNYTNDFGGELGRKIGHERTLRYMEEVDDILCRFGGGKAEPYNTENKSLVEKAARHSLQVLSTRVRHLGTELAQKVFQNMYEAMKNTITFTFEVDVSSIQICSGFTIYTNKGTFTSEKIVFATGTSGSQWLKRQSHSIGLYPGKTRLDLGIRVEMRGNQLDSILRETFETKLMLKGSDYTATTYCMNPKGRIIRKFQNGLVMPDGQNKGEKDIPGQNLNFTLFVPQYFDSHGAAMKEAETIIGRINRNRNRIVVQRLADLTRKKFSIRQGASPISPSLQAEFGSLHDEVPELYTRALLDFFEALEGLLEEDIDPDTLLYGIDAKFYEPKLYTNEQFETQVPGLYLVGDCSGETHSLSQAAASGLYLGSNLTKSQDE
ncbi:NAD(FAD)-utilizing dehydrogenase [Halobacillus andaensis]|uniref:NAD(FAD)-utilizing dehydrogenase n=1 Tax=Halobacillus andaensis TaxID=1176239 RepID=UPI003D7498DD